jgi:hypothetical protein
VPLVSHLWSRFISDETGAVAILVAVAFPIFMLAAVLAVDVSRWNVHKRQLQTQADAAALAAGSAWQFPCNSTTEASILAAAAKYGGDGGSAVNKYKDIPDANHHVRYNSTTYYPNRSASDPGAPSLTGHPCADNAIDVKVTENDVRAFFGLFNAKYIDATARAELKTATSDLNSTPIGVPLPAPSHVYAQFVNQSSLAPYNVTGTGVLADGKTFQLPLIDATNNVWQSSTVTPQGVQPGDKIGIRAVLDANNAVPTTPDCTAAGVECDSNEGNTWNTLEAIRQWSQTSPDPASDFAPYIKALRLTSGTCPDPYFADVPVTPSAGCNMTVNATIKFNVTPTNKETVKATVHLPSGDQTVNLKYLGSGDNWQSVDSAGNFNPSLPVTPNSARSIVDLSIEQGEGSVDGNPCKTNGSNPAACKVTKTDATRVFAANSVNSGYIQRIQVDQPGVQSFANSLAYTTATNPPAGTCSTASSSTCSYGLTVTIKVATLHIATAGERPVTLRILKDTTGNASKNGSLNCDQTGGSTLAQELANGCSTAYRVAVGNECDNVHQFGDMAANPPNPYPCVQEKPGENKQAVGQAMTDRILGGNKNSCTGAQDNQWDSGSPNDLPQSDPRRMDVFLTDFGIFSGSGRDFVPVRGFAQFYITGWSGQEKNNGNGASICSKNDPVPGDADGYLVGHFVKATAPPGTQDNGQACVPTDLNLCTAVLTR